MPDRDSVISGLMMLADRKNDNTCEGLKCCKIAEDALALLKEQEAKYGYWINPTSQDCHCSECSEQPVHEIGESVPLYDFCPYCGAKMEVNWNE